MDEEREPTIEELKEEAQAIEIPVDQDEDEVGKEEAQREDVNVVDAMRELGRQFAQTIQTAWDSEERRNVEREMREGMREFGDEVNKVLREVRESPAAKKVQEEAGDVRTRVESGEITYTVKKSMVDGLNWLSVEMAKLAEQFSPPAKDVPETEAEAAAEAMREAAEPISEDEIIIEEDEA